LYFVQARYFLIIWENINCSKKTLYPAVDYDPQNCILLYQAPQCLTNARKQHRRDKLWMVSVLSAFHIGLWENFSIYHRKNKHRRVSDSRNKHIHVDICIKFDVKSLILTYESEDRITDDTLCLQVCF
jgi:hypothetical protein